MRVLLCRLGAVALLGLTAAFALGGVARAEGVTHTVTFTGDGPSPASLSIHDGDRIEFRNDVDPTTGVPVLGPAAGALSSVSVTVSGATTGSFTLDRGRTAVVGPYHSGSKDLIAHYDSTYSSQLVLGTLPGPTEQTSGTVTVAAHSTGTGAPQSGSAGGGQPQTPASDAAGSEPTPGHDDAATPEPTGTGSSDVPSANSSDPADTAPTMPSIHYTPHGPDVAAEVVPHGDSGTYRTGAPSAPSSDRTSGQASNSSAAAAVPGAPDDPDSPALQPAAASSDRPGLPLSLDWTAVGALVLLCGVVGVLIRTLVVHRLHERQG